MKYITKHFKGHYKELILGPIYKLLEAVLELFVPLIMANIIDVGIAQQDQGYILTRGLLLLLLAILGVVMAMLCQYYAAKVGGAVGSSIRKDMFRHVMDLSGKDVGEVGTGALITRLTNDINQVQTGINMTIRLGTRAPFLAIGSIVMALLIDLKIGLIFLVSTPLIVFILYIIMKQTLPNYKSIQEEQDKLSRLSAENLAGTRVIRAFSRQHQEQEAYESEANRLTKLIERAGRISAALNPLTTLIVNLAIAVIVWMGATAVNSGTMESGRIVALVSYMNQTLLALIVAANLIVLFTRAIASARRIEAVMSITPSIQAEPNRAEHSEKGLAVAFQNVTFSYHAGTRPALEQIDFEINTGQMAGLIGGTGSGKSTIIHLIMRNFDVDDGTVFVNGQSVKGMDPKKLRQEIALVPQKAVLFSGTIRENLLMAAPNATDEALWEALEIAQAKTFVEAMPLQLESKVEEGGQNFSGGQRQRLTIARAVLRKPALMILDDAASALDLATDAALRTALRREMDARPNMTVLIIAQRVATIKSADKILVLDDGQLSAVGTHESLLQENDIYREICHSQGIGL